MSSPVTQRVKNLLAVQGTQELQVWSLGWEDPLKEEMVTHSSILAWKITLREEPKELQSMGLQRVRHDWNTKHSTFNLLVIISIRIPSHGSWFHLSHQCFKICLPVIHNKRFVYSIANSASGHTHINTHITV